MTRFDQLAQAELDRVNTHADVLDAFFTLHRRAAERRAAETIARQDATDTGWIGADARARDRAGTEHAKLGARIWGVEEQENG